MNGVDIERRQVVVTRLCHKKVDYFINEHVSIFMQQRGSTFYYGLTTLPTVQCQLHALCQQYVESTEGPTQSDCRVQ